MNQAAAVLAQLPSYLHYKTEWINPIPVGLYFNVTSSLFENPTQSYLKFVPQESTICKALTQTKEAKSRGLTYHRTENGELN